MNKLDLDYQNLLKDILENGIKKETRNGGTISVFGRQIRHKMSEGFPLLTTKKMAWKTMVTELLWFLRGDTNIKYLVDNDCHIWDGDAYKHYLKQFEIDQNNFDAEELAKGHNDQCWGYPILDHVKPTSKEYKRGQINAYLEGKADKPFFYLTKEEFINKIKTDDEFAKKWGELGPIYGKQWRAWSFPEITTYQRCCGYGPIDQIQNLINELKTNPDSRRLIVSAWNVSELDQMVLPPCHYGFQVYTRELTWEEQVHWVLKNTNVELENVYIVEEIAKPSTPKRAISLMWSQRSVDTFLGLPFNIASYGLLLEIIAKEVNMVPDELIGNLGDVHLYSNHVEQAKEQIGRTLTVDERMDWWFKNRKPNRDVCDDVDTYSPYAKGVYFDSIGVPKTTREPYPLPTVTLPSGLQPGSGNWDKLVFEDFYLNNYQSHPTIKAPLSN